MSHGQLSTGRTSDPQQSAPIAAGNAAQPWEKFDSAWYLAHNYANLRFDDKKILEWLADFFIATKAPAKGRGIDVGSGTNLYPSLAMLPMCEALTLVERSPANVTWLQGQVGGFDSTWRPFWTALADAQPDHYKRVDPRAAMSVLATVRQGSIFDLPVGEWDLGTMFFVAESITARREEFETATQNFVRALKPGSPFAAGFMKGSSGYWVDQCHFPAVAVHEDDISQCLAPVAYDVEVRLVPDAGDLLRDGYEGMILATGRAGPR